MLPNLPDKQIAKLKFWFLKKHNFIYKLEEILNAFYL